MFHGFLGIRRSVVFVTMLLFSAGAKVHVALADPETGAGSSAPPPAVTAAPAAAGVTLEIVPGQVQTHDELRVNTGKERDLGNGQKEPIYVLQRPRLGAVFLEIVLYVSTEGAPFTLAREDVSLVLPNTEVPPVPLRSLAVESGLLPEEVTVVNIDTQGIVRLTFEVERERLDSRVVQLGTLHLGTVAEIRAQVGE